MTEYDILVAFLSLWISFAILSSLADRETDDLDELDD